MVGKSRAAILPLQEVPNEDLGPMQIHVLFPLQDLRQIKLDLVSFTEDPDNYMCFPESKLIF